MVMVRRILAFAAMALVFLAACSNGQSAVTVKPGEVATIGVGQSVRISGEDMEIKFNKVIGDSRCPQNVVCIWEGVASSEITITRQGETYSMALNQPGLSDRAQQTFLSYTLIHGLNPYPREGEEIPPKEYQLTLTVTK